MSCSTFCCAERAICRFGQASMRPHPCLPTAHLLRPFRLLQVWAALTMVTDVQHRRMLFRFVHLGGECLARPLGACI